MKFETILERIGREVIRHLPFVAVALMVSLTASAQTTKRIPLPPSQNPTNADLPIAAAADIVMRSTARVGVRSTRRNTDRTNPLRT